MFIVPMTRSTAGLARHIDRLFDGSLDHLFGADTAQPSLPRRPALDVAESDQAYTVTLDLPGVAKGDVKVSIEGRRVSIEARGSKTGERNEGERVLYRERTESSYARSFALPAELDQERSSAKLDNGVLKLELAKREAARSTQVKIN